MSMNTKWNNSDKNKGREQSNKKSNHWGKQVRKNSAKLE